MNLPIMHHDLYQVSHEFSFYSSCEVLHLRSFGFHVRFHVSFIRAFSRGLSKSLRQGWIKELKKTKTGAGRGGGGSGVLH